MLFNCPIDGSVTHHREVGFSSSRGEIEPVDEVAWTEVVVCGHTVIFDAPLPNMDTLRLDVVAQVDGTI